MTLEPREVWGNSRHVQNRTERRVAQPLEANAVDRFTVADEPVISSDIVGIEAGNLGAHRRFVAAGVEDVAILKANLVEQRNRPKLDVVRHPPAAERPQLLEQERRGDNRRPGVKGEAVLAMHESPPSRGVELFHDRHAIAARAEPHSGRQAAEPAADDHRPRPGAGCSRCG